MKALVIKMLNDANKASPTKQAAIRRSAYAIWQQHVNNK